MATRAASAASGTTINHPTKRPHSAIATSNPPAPLSTLSLSSLAQPDSPSSAPASPPSPPSPFTRPSVLQQQADSHIPYLYDFYYSLPLSWPLYTMCWSHELPDSTQSYRTLTKSDQRRYRMHRLYYAQSTDASYDPYYQRFVGHPHTLIQAEMPLPHRANVADMEGAADGGEGVLEDVYCFPEADTRVLTNHGLLFLDEIEELRRADTEVLFGCYEVSKTRNKEQEEEEEEEEVESKALVYSQGELVFSEPPEELLEFTSPGEAERWTESSGLYGTEEREKEDKNNRHVSIRVTPNHRMFVQTGNMTGQHVLWGQQGDKLVDAPHRLVLAQEFLSPCRCLCSRKAQRECPHTTHLRMLACAEAGFTPQSTARLQAVRDDLGLAHDDQFTAFIELFGFWLGHGSVYYNASGNGCVCFDQVKRKDVDWLKRLLGKIGVQWTSIPFGQQVRFTLNEPDWFNFLDREFGEKYAYSVNTPSSPAARARSLLSTPLKWTKSVKWLPDWVLAELSGTEMRRLVKGLWRADGDWVCKQKAIFTPDVRFRDQLMQALLHCGYSPSSNLKYRAGGICGYDFCNQSAVREPISPSEHAGLSAQEQAQYRPIQVTVDGWRVSWADVRSTTGRGSCWPSMSRLQCITRVPYSATRDGRLWCVRVAHKDHLIIAQRAQRDTGGVVTKQSRPIIVGNCSYVTDFRKIAHPGEINRIRVVQQADDTVCTHTDSPRVYLWNFARQPARIVKKNCRPHWPDLQLVGHVETNSEEGKKPMYFALDTSVGSEAMVLSGGPDRQVCLWGIEDYVSSLSRTEPKDAQAASGNGSGLGRESGGGSSTVSELLQARGVFAGHSECVEDVCFHPHTAQQFASVGDDCLLNLWDARAALTPSLALHTGHTDDVNAVSYNPVYPHLLLTASSDHTVQLVDVRRAESGSGGSSKSGAGVVHVFRDHVREVKNVCWAADGVHFASGGDDALVNVHNITLLATPPAPPLPVAATTAAYHSQLAAASQPPSDPSLLFRHACHPSAVQCVAWYGGHRGGLTMASVSGETGGLLQVWRMNELLCGRGIEERNNAVKTWKRQRKERKDEEEREKVERGKS